MRWVRSLWFHQLRGSKIHQQYFGDLPTELDLHLVRREIPCLMTPEGHQINMVIRLDIHHSHDIPSQFPIYSH